MKKQYKDMLKKAKDKEKQKVEKEKQKAIEAARTAAKAEFDAQYREKIEQAEREKNEALEKAESVAAKLDKNADKDLVTASLYFSEAQTQLEKFMTAAENISATDPAKGSKLRKVAADFLSKYIKRLSEG